MRDIITHSFRWSSCRWELLGSDCSVWAGKNEIEVQYQWGSSSQLCANSSLPTHLLDYLPDSSMTSSLAYKCIVFRISSNPTSFPSGISDLNLMKSCTRSRNATNAAYSFPFSRYKHVSWPALLQCTTRYRVPPRGLQALLLGPGDCWVPSGFGRKASNFDVETGMQLAEVPWLRMVGTIFVDPLCNLKRSDLLRQQLHLFLFVYHFLMT